MRRLPAVLITCSALVLLASACGSDSNDSSGSSTTTASTTAPTTSSSTTSTTGGSTSTTAAPSNACTSAELSAELGPSDAGAGQIYQPLILRNKGSRSCDVKGFPGVSLLDSSGTQIGQPATRDGNEGPAVTLAPGAAASASLHTTNAGIGPACDPVSAQMKVFPPGQTAEIVFPAHYTACGGFTVTTLVSGEAGVS